MGVHKRQKKMKTNEPCNQSEENIQIVTDFVDSVKKHGDMDTFKEVKTALYDFNMEQNHRFDKVLIEFSQWMMNISNEHRINIFNGAVGAVDCNVDRQMFADTSQKKISNDRRR